MTPDMEPIYLTLGQRVIDERMRAGWTQADLACQVRLGRASIANVETGRQRLMLHQVELLAQVFDVSISDMIGCDAPNAKRLRAENAELRKRIMNIEHELHKIVRLAAGVGK